MKEDDMLTLLEKIIIDLVKRGVFEDRIALMLKLDERFVLHIVNRLHLRG